MSFFFARPRVKEVDPAETKRRLDTRAALVVDVREPHERHEGYIPGSKLIPLGKLQTHAAELLSEPEVIFVCRSGSRSATATAALAKAGHANVYNMAGGMNAWERSALPMKR